MATVMNSYTSSGATTLHSGKWTLEESLYVTELIKEFEAGSLNIEENISLRRFLSKALNCSPKRISKKFEGSLYNGKQTYKRKMTELTAQEVEVRRLKLKELEHSYRESLKVLKMVEASRSPSTKGTDDRKPAFPDLSSGLGTSRAPWDPPDSSREARVAKLKAEIALATLALEPAASHSGSQSITHDGTRSSLLLNTVEQSNILAALSVSYRPPVAQGLFSKKTLQDQAALYGLLSARSRMHSVIVAALQRNKVGSSLPTHLFASHHLAGFKHGLDVKKQENASSFKRIRLL